MPEHDVFHQKLPFIHEYACVPGPSLFLMILQSGLLDNSADDNMMLQVVFWLSGLIFLDQGTSLEQKEIDSWTRFPHYWKPPERSSSSFPRRAA
ncbi:uncharacterized protein ARMOST_09393 [Armillaria ostoyae]|uniref:Uncharacterized protein n=1 Tax=Armillaria ostoyae TaxID=47428 RepID=A0A284RBB8_ARMOS|nr:uncharacterized protein ARMOST_09393 [Armillaria ostoyae]